MLGGIELAAIRPLTLGSLENSCVAMVTPGTEACTAVGGIALRQSSPFRPEIISIPQKEVTTHLSPLVPLGFFQGLIVDRGTTILFVHIAIIVCFLDNQMRGIEALLKCSEL